MKCVRSLASTTRYVVLGVIGIAGLTGCNVTVVPPRAVVVTPRRVYVAPPVAVVAPAPVVVAPANPAVDPAIQELVAPIALYPDPILSIVLPASTYPQQIQQAQTWVLANPAPADADVDAQPWDPSVKALVRYPTVLAYMNDNVQWTTDLGGAVAEHQPEVMEAVQDLRAQAVSVGSLRDSPQMTVVADGPTIVIQPTDANLIFIPHYDVAVVYTSPVVIGFEGPGFVAGVWLVGGFDWEHHGFFYGHWHDWHEEWRGGHGHWDHFHHFDHGGVWRHDDHFGHAPHFVPGRAVARPRGSKPLSRPVASRRAAPAQAPAKAPAKAPPPKSKPKAPPAKGDSKGDTKGREEK